MEWCHILDWDDWEVVPTGTVCPLHAFLANKSKQVAGGGLLKMSTEGPTTLLRHAALQGFWRLGVVMLRNIDKAEDLGLDSKAGLVECLKALVRHAVPKISAGELFDILSLRTVSGGLSRETDLPSEVVDETFAQTGGKRDVQVL